MLCERCQVQLPVKERYISYDRQKKKREVLCFPCYSVIVETRKKANIVRLAKDNYYRAHLYRAKKLGLAATLTLEQWNKTKRHFHQMCAYCQKAPIECLEHFVPLELGLGTVWENIVPSCNRCNRRKGGQHPAIVKLIPPDDIERVREYLLILSELKNG